MTKAVFYTLILNQLSPSNDNRSSLVKAIKLAQCNAKKTNAFKITLQAFGSRDNITILVYWQLLPHAKFMIVSFLTHQGMGVCLHCGQIYTQYLPNHLS